MRVLTFSRYFPAHHIRQNEPTFFVEKIWLSIAQNPSQPMPNLDTIDDAEKPKNIDFPKHHTIRKGNRWKVGDKASLRVWADKLYRSKQIEFAQVEIKQVWDFEIKDDGDIREVFINKNLIASNLLGSFKPLDLISTYLAGLAQNDGLELSDFCSWFGLDKPIIKPLDGQLVCWSDEVNYD